MSFTVKVFPWDGQGLLFGNTWTLFILVSGVSGELTYLGCQDYMKLYLLRQTLCYICYWYSQFVWRLKLQATQYFKWTYTRTLVYAFTSQDFQVAKSDQ